MITYLTIGIIFYAYCCYKNPTSFKDASIASIARGLVFGILLWPAAMVFVWRNRESNRN